MSKLIVKRNNKEYTIIIIGSKLADEVIADVDRDNKEYLGLYIVLEEDGSFTGIDNRGGDAWTENFKTREVCVDWLLDDTFEESNMADKKESKRYWCNKMLVDLVKKDEAHTFITIESDRGVKSAVAKNEKELIDILITDCLENECGITTLVEMMKLFEIEIDYKYIFKRWKEIRFKK